MWTRRSGRLAVARKNTDPFFAYDANYLIDNKAGIIVDAEGTRASRIAEIAIARTMLDRVGRRFHLRPQRLAGDTGAVRLLKWLVDRNITPHIPVWDKSTRSDGTFSRADFVFDRERNVYICPGGKLLNTTGTVIDGGTLRYRAAKIDCDVCAFKTRCCPSTPMPYVPIRSDSFILLATQKNASDDGGADLFAHISNCANGSKGCRSALTFSSTRAQAGRPIGTRRTTW